MITKDSKNILLADDSLFFRTKLSDVLNEAGHNVMFAKDGSEAIKEIKRDPEGIDILILDMQMPNVDGLGVLKWIKDNGYGGKFPVLVITGAYEPTQVIETLKNIGAAGFMTKDLAPEQIVFRVNRLLFKDKAATGPPRKRVPASIPVDFKSGDSAFTGTILTISEGGVFLFTDVKFHMGTMLQMRFSLPGTEKILNVKGTVKWSPEEIEGKRILGGYGIMFTSLSQDDQNILKEFVSSEIIKLEQILNE